MQSKLQFKIEQIALCPTGLHRTAAAIELLRAMGLTQWSEDTVVARGEVFGELGENTADLAFNYEATEGIELGKPIGVQAKPLELEVLSYTDGPNWMATRIPSVSHLGMHVSAEELLRWRAFFAERHIGVAQEVITQSHTNPAIRDSRRYNYVIFDTDHILGVDIKFIVRLPYSPQAERV